MNSRRPDDWQQVATLRRTFVARFFENEITGGSADLRASFIWLIAFLAPLGIALPWLRIFDYEGIFLRHGPEALRRLSMADKVLYLGFGMVASGVLAVITWKALGVDRRDALVLGPLPIPDTTISRAKMEAVVVYVGLVALGMHAGASVCFGLILSRGNGLEFLVRGMLAHLIASSLASMFVLFLVTTLQTVLLAATGPRVFARVSTAAQIVVTGTVLVLLLLLPKITTSVVAAISVGQPSWVLATPPVWFLGLYEWILGTGDPTLRRLASRGATALVASVIVTMLVSKLAHIRVIRSAVESSGAERANWFGGVPGWIIRTMASAPATRASLQLMAATFTRVETHRLILAIGAGATAAFVLPLLVSAVRLWSPLVASPSASLLSAPIAALVFSLVALRLAVSLPAQLTASWLVRLIEPSPRRTRAGVWRAMFALGVIPAVAVFSTGFWAVWGWKLAAVHAVVCVSAGAMLTEVLLWGFEGMPCTRVWRPEHAEVKKWWPVYIGAFLVITQGVPQLTLTVQESPLGVAIVASVAALGTLTVRVIDRHQVRPAETSYDEPEGVQWLNLD